MSAHPVKNTSGGGYAFENRVGAWLAAAMLAGRPVVGAGLGPPRRIEFQVEVEGHQLDDVLVTFRLADIERRWVASIKSSPQFAATSAPADFTQRCWRDLVCGSAGGRFDPGHDLLGFITAPIGRETRADLQELVRLAVEQAPMDLDRRVAEDGYLSANRRALWKSFAPDVDFDPAPFSRSPGEVLSRLLHVECDFADTPSDREAQALQWCEEALADPSQAPELWVTLLDVVSMSRTAGGAITDDDLRARLRDAFMLVGKREHDGDRRILREVSAVGLAAVRDTLASGVCLPRPDELAALDAAAQDPFVAIIGPSGVGKTALAKTWSTDREVLWLDAEALPGLATAGPTAQLQHSLPEVLAAWPTPVWVVIDRLDRAFSREAFLAVGTLAWAVRDGNAGAARIIVTSQQQEWPRLTDTLSNINASVSWTPVAVGAFQPQQLNKAYEGLPALRGVALRSGLSTVLANAKVLDVITSRLGTGDTLDSATHVHDEATFATWFVEYLGAGGGPDRLGRRRALLALAVHQADTLESVTGLLDVPGGADHLDGLQRDGVCVVEGSSVRLAHDLYGDWARYDVLNTNRDDLESYLSSRLDSPLWHRAVRLYASGLLGDAAAWRAELDRIAPGALGLVHDLFLDAAIFAGEEAVQALWPQLVADDGRLLRRLLRRVQTIGTLPNPLLIEQITAVDASLSVIAATMQRVPYWPLWLPVLAALDRHVDDLLRLATEDVAECVGIWLCGTPSDYPGRAEAADIAIRLAAFVTEHIHVLGMSPLKKVVWRAVLGAVTDRPAEVRSVLEILTGDQDTETDRELRDVCLDGNALNPVILADPSLAADVLVAVVAPRPINDEYSDLFFDRLGMDRLPEWPQAIYTRGPFLPFLRTAPDEAVGAILRIVELATDRWQLTHDQEVEDAEGITLLGGENELVLRGGAEAMMWHRAEGQAPSTLASGLMALEKYLYDEQDAEHDIAPLCDRLLRETTSVGIAGLLVSIACRDPRLLAGTLLPLASSAELLLWDQASKLYPRDQLLLGLVDSEPIRELLTQWTAMEHRMTKLVDVAQRQVLFGDPAPFAAFRARWLDEVGDDGEPVALRVLAARLDPANWHQRTLDGVTYMEVVPPADLQAISEATTAEVADRQFWMMFPFQCRRWLSGEEALDSSQLEELWIGVKPRLDQAPAPGAEQVGVVDHDDARCGLAAVLLVGHAEWLAAHPDRATWCRDAVLEAINRPREHNITDSDVGGLDHGWDAFCGQALPHLWAQAPTDQAVRAAVAKLAGHLHFRTVGLLFAESFAVRSHLGEDFDRLRHLAVHIAQERWHHDRFGSAREPAASKAAADLVTAVAAFVDSTLEPSGPRWAHLTVPDDRRMCGLDPDYLNAAHRWIPPLDEVQDATELDDWISFFTESIEALVRRLERDRSEDVNEASGSPYEHEFQLLYALPARVLQVPPDKARSLWEPILALGPYAHYWVDTFLRAWFTPLARSLASSAFAREWRAMLDYVAGTPSWGEGSYRARELRWLILGLAQASAWTTDFAADVTDMVDYYRSWAAVDLADPDAAAHFARFLASDAADGIRDEGLIWLAKYTGAPHRRQDTLDEALEPLLSALVTGQPTKARSQTLVGEAIRKLLRGLADRQRPVALELLNRLQG